MSLSEIKKSSQKKKANSAFNPVKKAVYPSEKKLYFKKSQFYGDEPFDSNEENIQVKHKELKTPIKKEKLQQKTIILKTKRISKKQRSSVLLKQGIINVLKEQEPENLPKAISLYDITIPIKLQAFINQSIQDAIKEKQSKGPKKAHKNEHNKIFYSEEYNLISEIDFEIFFRLNLTQKMYSTILLTEKGEIIFVDRLGSELFEGSLNNLQRNPIQSIILQCRLPNFLQKAKLVSKQNSQIIKLVIYSKNSKRRYSKVSNNNLLSHEDIYNRYLKCISVKVMPIEIKFENYQNYEGYWKKSLVKNNVPLKCYLFRARLAKHLPDLVELDFENDKKITKFIDYTKKKLDKISSSLLSIKQEQISEQNIQEDCIYETPQRRNVQCSFEHFKQYECCQKLLEQQRNDIARYQKCTISAMTRGGLLGSASQKEGKNITN